MYDMGPSEFIIVELGTEHIYVLLYGLRLRLFIILWPGTEGTCCRTWNQNISIGIGVQLVMCNCLLRVVRIIDTAICTDCQQFSSLCVKV
jgi:hypothetical protein